MDNTTSTQHKTITGSLAGDAEIVGATFTLTQRSEQYPELARAERLAHLQLAAAILAMDAAADIPGRHNLMEQAEVNVASTAYAQALADLLRGETS